MAVVIRMPKMSDTMTEGVIVAWHKKEGDTVKPGDILADVETDKATMELENFEKGILLHIGIKEGQAVPIDAVIAVVGAAGEDYKALIEAPKAASAAESLKAETNATEAIIVEKVSSDVVAVLNSDDSRIKASPLAKSIAKEKGIALNSLVGSGENGRIVKRDLENIQSSSVKGSAYIGGSLSESYDEIPVSQMRKTIARRLLESKN